MASSTNAGTRGENVPLQLVERDGERALLLPRWRTPARANRAVLGGLALALVVGGTCLAAFTDHSWGVLLIPVGIAFAGVFVRDVLKQPYDGGVWLSPTSITHRWGHRQWSLAWADVLSAEVVETRDVLVRSRLPEAGRLISTHLLVLAPAALVALVEVYAQHPDRRGLLATQAGLDEAETVRRGHSAGFEMVVHGQMKLTKASTSTTFAVIAAVFFVLVALGRHVSVDRDSLQASVRAGVEAQGVSVSAVSCDGSTRRKVGETQDCGVTVDGQRRNLQVTVTKVAGDQVSYRFDAK